MKNTELRELNNQANQQIEAGVNELKEKFDGGLDIGGMFMNPTKAVSKFGDGLMQIIEGIEKMRAVNNELVNRLTEEG